MSSDARAFTNMRAVADFAVLRAGLGCLNQAITTGSSKDRVTYFCPLAILVAFSKGLRILTRSPVRGHWVGDRSRSMCFD